MTAERTTNGHGGTYGRVGFKSTEKLVGKKAVKKKTKRKTPKEKPFPMRSRSRKKPAGGKKLAGIDPKKLLAGLSWDDDAAEQIIAAGGANLFKNGDQRTIADRAVEYFRDKGQAPGDSLYDLIEEAHHATLLEIEQLWDLVSLEFADSGFAAFRRHDVEEAVGQTGQAQAEGLTMRCAKDIPTERLRPLWPNMLYRRKVSIIAGDPGLGKSLLTCYAAARVTRADGWVGGVKAVADPSPVVMISGEDDAGDTIIPRLIAAGADLSKVHLIEDVVESEDGELSTLSIDGHMDEINQRVVAAGAALLIIDPISSFMGNRDAHKDTAVRALINKIRRYAIEGNYAVLLVTHFNKPGERSASAIYRIMGSIAFQAGPRSSFALIRDPTDPDYRLFLPIKFNLGPDQQGFRCCIEADMKQRLRPPPARLVWDKDAVEDRVDEILAQASPREQAKKAKKAKIAEWLHSRVPPGKMVHSIKFNDEAMKRSFGEKLVREVMAEEGFERKGKEGTWPTKWYVRRSKR